jgi:hypothetical protein
MSRRLRTAVLSMLVTAAMVGTGSAAVAASPQTADGFSPAPRTAPAVTAADRNPGGRDAHRGDEGRRDEGRDVHRGDEGRRDDGGRDARRGDDGRRDAGIHGDRRDHRDMDHGHWYGRNWDHRGGTWYGWSWEQQCEWAWYNDAAWYDEYCA